MLHMATDRQEMPVTSNTSSRVGTLIGIALMVATAAVVLSGAVWCVAAIWKGIFS